ncbi:hypothetical protein P3342_013582 [Pyrenophora teres f. teres]|nr:hypothetical protein P3342_013582 [Pyrenophora teres f. teres]
MYQHGLRKGRALHCDVRWDFGFYVVPVRGLTQLKFTKHFFVASISGAYSVDMMQIPKADSIPIDPEEASFLTTFPAEMRNLIYDLLFKKDKPILLHNAEAFHPKEPSLEEYFNVDDYALGMQNYWKRYEEDVGLDEEFRHNFGDGLNLLSSCRQLYHEASGVLYGQNTFIISGVLSLHDTNEYYAISRSRYDDPTYSPPMYAARWLSSLGSQAELLSEVIIDTDALCLPNCFHSVRGYNILPLSGRASYHLEYQSSNFTEEEMSTIHRTKTLNNLLTALVEKNTFNLRRFDISSWLLQSIEVSKAGTRGFVKFYNPDPPVPPHMQDHRFTRSNFEVSSQGRHMTWAPRTPPKFTDMPPHIMSRIYKFACYNPYGVTFNLDTHTLHGVNMDLFHWGRFVLGNAELASSVSHMNRVTIKATSDRVVTNFNGFGYINHLTLQKSKHRAPKIFEGMINQARTDPEPLTLSLEIYPSHAATLSDVRVDIESIMHLLLKYKLHPKATIKLTLICPSGWQEQTSISIAKLQRQLFLLFSDMISEMKKLTFLKRPSHFLTWELWINGHGKLLNAIYPESSFKYAYRYGNLSEAEIDVLGSRRSIDLIHPQTNRRYPNDLLSAWKLLRNMHWPEWEERSLRLEQLIPPYEEESDDD